MTQLDIYLGHPLRGSLLKWHTGWVVKCEWWWSCRPAAVGVNNYTCFQALFGHLHHVTPRFALLYARSVVTWVNYSSRWLSLFSWCQRHKPVCWLWSQQRRQLFAAAVLITLVMLLSLTHWGDSEVNHAISEDRLKPAAASVVMGKINPLKMSLIVF